RAMRDSSLLNYKKLKRCTNRSGARKRIMRPMQMDLFGEMDEQVSTIAMDVDDVDPLEIFPEGAFSVDNKLADADFFNNFQDDFDDADIN
ncbi:Stromal membrane-associated protein 1, partial [Stylosanthes scabra]|nr:Stromal membrane-associated protein 1 [Stylosanthes scabra]